MSATEGTLQTVLQDNLVLHLKLDSIQESKPARVLDSSGNNYRAIVHGSPTLVPDDRFGSCLRFNRNDLNTYLELPRAEFLSLEWTFSAWVSLEAEDVRDPSLVARVCGNQSHWELIVTGEGISLTSGEYVFFRTSESPLGNKQWAHIALALKTDGSTSIGLVWVNGSLVSEVSLPPLSESAFDTMTIGSWDGAPQEVRLLGKMTHVRLYNRALSPEEIQRQVSLDKLTMLNFSVGSPLEFDLEDQQQDKVIYVEGGEKSHKLTLKVWNRDPEKYDVVLQQPDMTLLGEDRDDFFKYNHHLELRFPRGLISKNSAAKMIENTGSLWKDGWYIHYHENKNLRSDSIYLLYPQEKVLSAAVNNIPGLEIALHLTADVGARMREAPVELRAGPLARRSDGAMIVGTRMTTLAIVSQRGRKNIPLHFDIVGPNTVLNNNGVSSWLLLRLTNVDRLESIPIDSSAQFILACEISNEQEWALTDESKKVQVYLFSAAKGYPNLNNLGREEDQENWSEVALNPEPDRINEWLIDGPRLHNLKITELKPKASIYLSLKVQTSLSSGPTDLHLYYHIPGYWDGSQARTILKSQLIFHQVGNIDDQVVGNGVDFIGIGTNSPLSKLSVTDGLTVGDEYAAKYAAPLNGLLIQGNAGIGVPEPHVSVRLHVKQDGEGHAAIFEGGTGVAIGGVTGVKNTLSLYNNTTSAPTLAVANNGGGAGLYVKQEGEGQTALFEGGAGVAISGVTGAKSALNLSNHTTSAPTLAVANKGDGATLHVKQEGEGSAALFEGGSVAIGGVTGAKNALNLYNNTTSAATLAVANKGDGAGLYVKQDGEGITGWFEGGAGVAIGGVTGAKNALNIYNNTTSYPTLYVGNKGAGAALYAKAEGTGNAAEFQGNIKVWGDISLGTSGQLKAVGASQALRLVRGTWDEDAKKRYMAEGQSVEKRYDTKQGFKIEFAGPGLYKLFFDFSFASKPTVVITVNSVCIWNAEVFNLTNNSFDLQLRMGATLGNYLYGGEFSFIAIG